MALYRVPTQNSLQYTLDAQLAAGGNSLTLNQSVSGIVRAPGVGWVDRIDSSGNITPTKREYFTFTGVSGAQLTGLTRGLAGSTDQVHAVGAIVELGPDVLQEQNWYDTFTTEHNDSGLHTGITGSTASLNIVNTRGLLAASGASVLHLGIASGATTAGMFVTSIFSASGASIQSYPITPVWVLPGTLSGASTSAGKPLDMPNPGTIQWISAVSRVGASNASLALDILKNGSSILGSAVGVLVIPTNGTYCSTASVATPRFNAGDVFTVDIKTPALSQAADVSVKFFAR